MKYITHFRIIALFLIITLYNSDNLNSQCIGPVGQNAAEWINSFSEEFEAANLNSSIWNDHIWYESSDPVINYTVSDGRLKIWPDQGFVNRTIDTDGKFEQTFGYFEARMKLNIGQGCWPAFWLYAHPENNRPEIDIMEAYPGGGPSSGWGNSQLHPVNYGMTLHKANEDYSWHEVPFSITYAGYYPEIDLSASFHVYGVKWASNLITFYFDGQQVGPTYTYTDSYWNAPMYILIDLWFGSASGTPNITDTPMGINNSFEIDYVRAWEPGVCSTVPVTWENPLWTSIKDNKVLLYWSVAQELNNDYFAIEHSVDGFSFKEIGAIDGNGNSYSPKSYTFIHEEPETGINYYRIRQVDLDGTYKYSHIVLVDYEGDKISIYPNPAYNTLYINTGISVRANLYDQFGHLVAKYSFLEGINSIDIGALISGMYLLKLENGMVCKFYK